MFTITYVISIFLQIIIYYNNIIFSNFNTTDYYCFIFLGDLFIFFKESYYFTYFDLTQKIFPLKKLFFNHSTLNVLDDHYVIII